MKTITINIRQFPILHSEYIQNIFDYTDLSSKDRKLYDETKFALFQLVQIDVPDSLVEFFIDGKKFSPALIQSISFQQLLEDINTNQIKTHITSQIPGVLEYEEEKVKIPANDEILSRIKRVNSLAKENSYPEFYYYQIPISEEELFITKQDYKKIKKEYLPFLPFLDLSKVEFANMDFRKIDFSNTNIEHIDFSTAYQNSIAGSSFKNVCLIGKQLENIDATSADLCGTYLTINSDTVSLKDTKLDSSILLLSQGQVIENPERKGYFLVKENTNIKLHF